MSRAVRFERYGGVEVLDLVDVGDPAPGPEEVLVRIRATSANPGEAKIRDGSLDAMFPTTFPSGEGSDVAGVVEEVGPHAGPFAAGDEVIGWTDGRAAHAELVAVPAANLVPKPPALEWEVAGTLYVAGATAWAMVRAVDLRPGDTVVVSGAAGGVGCFAIGLAVHAGATVIGIAGEGNHDWLRSRGVIPVAYGDGVADRIGEAAPDGVDALVDCVGGGYVELAIGLGVSPERIDTVVDYDAAAAHGAKTDGNAAGAEPAVVARLAALIVAGAIEVPIAATYPLAEVRAAYTRLAEGHIRGKVVLLP